MNNTSMAIKIQNFNLLLKIKMKITASFPPKNISDWKDNGRII